MDKQKTPEEKLLKLIRKKKNSKDKSSQTERPKQSKKVDKNTTAKGQRVEVHVLRNVNRLLILVALCISGYCLAQLFILFNRDKPAPIALGLPKKNVETHKTLAVKEKPLNVYLQEIERHDIFQTPWAVEPQGINQVVNSSNLDKELKLVGIVLDDDSKAVVEDLKTKQTLFLSEGEQINGIFVEKISEDKVIFLHNGERIELVK